MKIVMSGLEHELAPIALREKLSFTKAQNVKMVDILRSRPHVRGCVLISTCNRTELYLSCDGEVEPGRLLCQAASVSYEPYRDVFVTRQGEDAARHLMEVAAGLRSRIWGEDQIIAQVKDAISLARQGGGTDSVLETLFRTAIASGKEVRTKVHLTALPTSAASMAVALLKEKMGDLRGKRALVIGNGEMGRLSASLLQSEGCQVAVTLRTYRHGQTIVPPGCSVVPYDERELHMDGANIVISATTSPHHTVTLEQMESLAVRPAVLVDLAIPRDIQQEVGSLPGVALYNIDDIGDFSAIRQVPEQVSEIINAHLDNFYRWLNYRDCMGPADRLKHAIVDRLLTARELEKEISETELLELAVGKTVDLLVSGLAERITAEQLTKCETKIRARTTGKQVVG